LTGVGRRPESELPAALSRYVTLDLADAESVRSAVADAAPEWVFHLAADASVARSWQAPAETLSNNIDTTLNVLDAVRAEAPEARVLAAGSGEIYGSPERLPVDESHPLRPQNPYALSKSATDLMGGFYADAHGVTVVRTRAFNHFGPGQSDDYVVSAFARQIAEAERRGDRSVTVMTGNLESRRDFTDVRDVARAYVLLLERAEPGAFNICSGTSRSGADILAALARESALDIEHRTDPQRLRKHEVMDIRGSYDRLTQATGWTPEIPFETSIRDTLDWWRSR
jgi:GDP-4-dehydro-6-deoxy-D-mannose reductase